MCLIKKMVVAALLTSIFVSAAALASLTKPENGKEYQTLAQPQLTDTKDKVEVIEFFYYSCPHCHVLDPYMTEWVKKQGGAILFKRIPVNFGQELPMRRMYYTLEAMGKLNELHPLIFKSIHEENQRLRTDKARDEFLVKNGIDAVKFKEVSTTSFTVETKMRRAQSLQEAYKIESVPVLFVDGKYMTSPAQVMTAGMTEVSGVQGLLQVLDALVLKAKKEHEVKK